MYFESKRKLAVCFWEVIGNGSRVVIVIFVVAVAVVLLVDDNIITLF